MRSNRKGCSLEHVFYFGKTSEISDRHSNYTFTYYSFTVFLGDFFVTHDFVRVFLVDTKTDNYKSGQWTTFSASSPETSVYTLIQNLVKNIVVNVFEESPHNLTNFPIMFKSWKGSGNDHEIPKITYNKFLKELETACVVTWVKSCSFCYSLSVKG